MENYQGDLADIIRATGSSVPNAATPEWQLPTNPVIGYCSVPSEDFGDPFNGSTDPFLHDIDTPIRGFFHNSNTVRGGAEDSRDCGDDNGNINGNLAQKILDEEMKRPSNILSRMLQISPKGQLPLSPRGLKIPPMLVHNDHSLISPNNSKDCLMENPAGLQISSPQNTGIKRRKSQAKKVICIQAPAPANSRATGEVVPSDLWAWRKYGQKPIKGSPYPRGYYRCSSSKGCSARKQVERSRTDPNMLVITYTSEHNHPWPTQRNALAGSTRSQPSKNKNSPNSQQQKKPTNPKDEQYEINTENANMKENNDRELEDPKPEVDDHPELIVHEGFMHSYKPTLPESDSFFSELGEIEAHPLHLLFEDARESKSLDSFSFYDWAGTNTAAAAATSGANKDSS